MNYLCLDYGDKHLGLAIASTPLAEPLLTISTSQAAQLLPGIIDNHHIDHIIIGLPEGKVGESVKKFAASLEELTHLPITLHDETLTSQQASQHLKTAKKKKRTGPDHHFAAALILQDYLDFAPKQQL